MAVDNFGREIKISIDELKASLVTSTGKVKDNTEKQRDNTDQLKKLNDNLTNIIGGQFHREMQSLNKLIKRVADACDEANKNRKTKGSNKDIGDLLGKAVRKVMPGYAVAKKSTGTVTSTNDKLCACLCNCIRKLNKRGTVQTASIKDVSKNIGQAVAKSVDKQDSDKAAKAAKAAMRKPSRKETPEYWKGMKAGDFVKDVFSGNGMDAVGRGVAAIIGNGVAGIGALFGPIGAAVTAFLGGFVESVIGALVKPFIEEIAQQGDELQTIWSQTGYGIAAAQEEQKKFRVTDQEISDLMMTQLEARKQLLKISKKGITDEKTLKSVFKSGASLSVQIGSNTEATLGMFEKWNLELGLSNFQLNSVSRGMQYIAKQTGITGDNLLNVAKNSEQFLKNMKGAGTLSAIAANNIMHLAALSEKTGTSELGKQVTGALTTSYLSRQMDDTTRRLQLLMMQGANAKQMEQYRGGTAIKDPETMKLAAKNLDEFVRSAAKARFGGKELEQLTAEEKGEFSEFLKEVYGINAGFNDLMLMINNLKEAGKSYAEKLEDLQKKINNATGPKKADLERQKEALYLGQSNTFLEEFMDALKRTKDVTKATGELAGNKDFAKLAEIAGTDLSKGAEAVTDILKKRIASLNKRAGELGTTKASDDLVAKANEALKANNVEGFKDIVGQIQELENEADNRARVIANPVEGIKSAVNKIVSMIQEIISTLIDKVLPLISKYLPDILTKISEIADVVTRAFRILTGEKPESALKPDVVDKAVKDMKAPPGGFSAEELANKKKALEYRKMGLEYDRKTQEAMEKEFEERTANENIFEKAIRAALRAAGRDNEYNQIQQRRKDVEAEGEAIKKMEDAMTNPGSIYTHDIHLEKLLEDGIKIDPDMDQGFGGPQIDPKMDQGFGGPMVNPKMPGMANSVEDEIRRRKAEAGGDTDMAQTEANTGATAANTRAMVRLLAQLGRLMLKRGRGNDIGIEGPDYPLDAFFGEILNVDWLGGTALDTVGLEIE